MARVPDWRLELTSWAVERVVHFGAGEFVKDGFVHFGFHDRFGRHFVIAHWQHFLGLVGADGRVAWTVAAEPVFADVPNVQASLAFPMYVDALPDGSLLVSNFGNAQLYRVDVAAMTASLLVDGRPLGMADMGNCVVDGAGSIWLNEVTGCRVWRFDDAGRVLQVLGDGHPGFQRGAPGFDEARFNWIYDLRLGPDGLIYVLDSRSFMLRAIDVVAQRVVTVAGNGNTGYTGDGGPATDATFGSDPDASFDGPISLSLDETGNAYVGDRHNHVVRMIDRRSGVITTIAGSHDSRDDVPNDPGVVDPLRLNLPQISSMDYHGGQLLVPTDISSGGGDLAVLRRSQPVATAPR